VKHSTRFLGLDVHKDSIAVAVCDEAGHAQSLGTIPNTPEALARLVRKLGAGAQLQVAYEAGPCGYVLYRQLTRLGIPCLVAAPTLIPVRSGDRVKTDRRDALKLARYLRSGDLTPVYVPDEATVALRDLLRARLCAKADQRRARNRLQKLLLRLGVQPPEPCKAFSVAYRRWLDTLVLPQPAQQRVLLDCLAEVAHQDARVQRLEAELEAVVPAQPPQITGPIAALRCLHGVELLTAATVVTETGELTRFDKAGQLFSYAGLVPSEHSSGGPAGQRRGGLTKTGNAHLRRILTEAAWHYQSRPRVSAALHKRRQGQDPRLIQIADQAHQRLYRTFRKLEQKGKPACKAATAVSRELLGFMWALAKQLQAGGGAPAATVG
jgi:transposase